MPPFANPDVDEEAVDAVRDAARAVDGAYPWDLLDAAERRGIDREEARKALRRLRLANAIVPAGEFIGRVRLAED